MDNKANHNNNYKRFILLFSDLSGTPKTVSFPERELGNVRQKGKSFDGSSIEGLARVYESDSLLIPDPEQEPVMDSNSKKRILISDVYNMDYTPHEGDPRYILKRYLEIMNESLGKETIFYTAPEPEFYLFGPNNQPLDNDGYFDQTTGQDVEKFRDIFIEVLEKRGIECETDHHEVGPSQQEVDIVYGDALYTADKVILYKKFAKEIAEKLEMKLTFMPKPMKGNAGSGMHYHLNIKQDDQNLFYDKDGIYNLSTMALHFIGGLMKKSNEIAPILCSTINSYKRLGEKEAPSKVCWGKHNRSTYIRIPGIRKGEEPKKTRIELRAPDPAGNPYLQSTAILAAGLWGIENKIKPDEPVNENVYNSDKKFKELPKSLESAMKRFENSTFMKEALGPTVFKEYIKLKKEEIAEYNSQITQWEKEKYM